MNNRMPPFCISWKMISKLNKRKIRRYFPSDESINDDRPYTNDEIQRIRSVCDLRSKAMVLLMGSSGVRICALSSMQIGHLTLVTFNGLTVYKIQVYADTRDRYITFLLPNVIALSTTNI